MERAESCRGLISGHPNTASRMGKQRLKAGKGSDFRPLVAEDMACTAAAIAGCCGIGTKSCFPPESNTEVFIPARGNVIINKLSQFNSHFFQSYLHCQARAVLSRLCKVPHGAILVPSHVIPFETTVSRLQTIQVMQRLKKYKRSTRLIELHRSECCRHKNRLLLQLPGQASSNCLLSFKRSTLSHKGGVQQRLQQGLQPGNVV